MVEEIPKKQLAIVVTEDLEEAVREIPVFEPKEDEVLIKAVAWCRTKERIPLTPANINSIAGYDVSGVVVKIGRDITLFKVGDQVSSLCVGGLTPMPATGAYSEYVISREHATYKHTVELISTDLDSVETGPIKTFEQASTIPNNILTVGASFYGPFNLRKGNDYSNDIFLIWSGGSSIGTLLVQIAVWLGFKEVIATCSPSKFELLKKLGASSCYDYNDKDVVKQIRVKYGDEINYGLDCFAHVESFSLAYEATSRTKPVKLGNLQYVEESDLPNVTKKTNKVEILHSSSFESYGDELDFIGRITPAQPHLVEIAKEYQRDILPLLESNKLWFLGLVKVEDGLYGLLNPDDSKAPSNFRFFARAVETKK